jgi:hypothetical protein
MPIDATRQMAARVSTAPITNINNQRIMNVSMPMNVSSGMDAAWVQAIIRQTIREEFAGGV